MINHIIGFQNNSQSEIQLGEISHMTELNIALTKLRYGGKLYFHGVDYKELCREAYLGIINEAMFNAVLKKSKELTCIETIVMWAESNGLKVIEKYFDNYHYHILLERIIKNV